MHVLKRNYSIYEFFMYIKELLCMLSTLKHEASQAIKSAPSLQLLLEVRAHYLGKKGLLTQALKNLSSLSVEEKKTHGKELNAIRTSLETLFEEKQKELSHIAINEKLHQDAVDVTLPPMDAWRGGLHPLSSVMQEIKAAFRQKGFQSVFGPDIEDEYHNFDALNIPSHHPARQNHDTFYFPDGRLLRTHTSSVQIRSSKQRSAPFRLLSLGRVYRCDYDATHSPMFHQCEGLVIEKGLHMGHLKATIIDFCRSFFGITDLPVRFRPSFFPFTEPSAEVDIAWDKKTGKVGQGNDWLEVLGCGMVHPVVLETCGVGPSDGFSGFAFGLGIERFTMLKYGIKDLRAFYHNDMPWLEHYTYAPHMLRYLST
jgi:phenylalanyl-tRNA synthetase alpha chain